MSEGERTRLGAAAGAVGVILFLVAALVQGERPPFDAPGEELAAHLDADRTRLQVSCALFALAVPFFVWFLATVSALAGEAGPAARRTGTLAYGCGLLFMALFTTDVATIAVSALRPESIAAEPELATALRDIEFLLMGMAAPLVSTMLACFAVLSLRRRAVWPPWVGRLAALAAAAYALRLGTLFTTDGPFAADGVLGIYVPVAALLGWVAVASARLARGRSA